MADQPIDMSQLQAIGDKLSSVNADQVVQNLGNLTQATNAQTEYLETIATSIAAIALAVGIGGTYVVPSGSTNGRPIKVAASSSPGTAFHTASASKIDRVWMWATNTDSSARTITVQFGGTTSPDDNIVLTINPGDSVLAVAGVGLTNSLVVRAFGSAANVITMYGYILRSP